MCIRDRSEGSIQIDGMDIRHIKLADLRNNIGIVQQDVYLFAGTIMDNIRYGNPNATDEEVIRAAKRANAHEFIMSFPEEMCIRDRYESLSLAALRDIAKARKLKGVSTMKKSELIELMLEQDEKDKVKEVKEEIKNEKAGVADIEQLDSGMAAHGIIEVLPDGYGFIRSDNYLPGENDVYAVSYTHLILLQRNWQKRRITVACVPAEMWINGKRCT